jgi:PAS domain S-box-containing protein
MNDKNKSKEELLNELKEWQEKYDSLKAIYDKETSQQKKVEEALFENENNRFRKIVENAPIAMAIVSMEGKIEFINHKAINVFGYLPEDIPTMDRWWVQAYPDENYRKEVISDWTGRIQRALNENIEIIGNEYHTTSKDGTVKTFFISGAFVSDKIFVLFDDITSRKKAEEELKNSKELLELSFKISPDIAIITRLSDGLIVDINERFVTLSEYKREEAIGKTTPELNLYENIENRTKVVEEIKMKGFSENNEIVFRTKSGKLISGIMSSQVLNIYSTPHIYSIIHDISERKQMENQIKESESKFRKIYENGPLGMALVGKDFYFSMVNSTFCRMMGYSEQELKKLTFKDITHPDDLSRDIEFINKLVKGEIATYKTEKRYIRKDNQIIWGTVTLTSNKVGDGTSFYFVAMIEDITERKRIEDLLVQSETKYRTLVETTNTGFVIIDNEGKVEDANLEYVRLTGYENLQQILNRNVAEWTAKYDRERNLEEVKKCFKNGFVRNLEVDYVDLKGNYTPIEVNATVVNIGGKDSVVTLCRNISQYKQTEMELIKAKEKAEESDRLKTAFLQNMSHEIRTPMNAICGFSRMLNKPDLSEEKRKSFSNIIQNSGQQLLSIVSDILTISSIDTKQEKVNYSNVCVNNIILDLLVIFKQQAMNRNISLFSKQQLTDIQSEITTDKTKLTQILTNLLVNALKFTHEGFIEFGYSLNESELEFYVKDTGIGINAELQEKIFERFRQADFSINKKYGGTGLGLSISKGFVELLGGKIWVQSEVDKGSTFFFTIPYKPVSEFKTDNKSNSTQKQYENYKTIMVAEDEEFNFLFIEEIFINMKLNLIHTKDGKEAVEACKSNPNINLVLMDIQLPIMDGHTAAKKIKEFRPDLPIIAQSAYALEKEIEEYSGIFNDYLIKPIQEEELIRKIKNYIDLNEIKS